MLTISLHNCVTIHTVFSIRFNDLRDSCTVRRMCNPCYNLKNYGGRSFAVAAPRLWNALPMVVKSSNSVETFKRKDFKFGT